MLKKILLVLMLLIFLAHQQRTFSQALPTGPITRVATGIAGVIERQLIRRGFSANDPRFASTLSAVGGAANSAIFTAGSTVGMAIAGIAGAPVWATVAIGLGVGALAFGAYKLLTGSKPDDIAVVSPATDPVLEATGPISTEIYHQKLCLPGQPDCVSVIAVLPSDVPYKYNVPMSGGDVVAIRNYADIIDKRKLIDASLCAGHSNCKVISHLEFTDEYGIHASAKITFDDGAGIGTLTSQVDGSPNPSYVPQPLQSKTTKGSIGSIAGSIPPEELAKPISNTTMADMANAAWARAASSPGYNGLPYSVTDPITPQDAADFASANPSRVPVGSDLLSPIPNGVVSMPSTSTGTNTSNPSTGVGTNVNVVNTPSVNVINSIKVDLGQDPSIQAPNLEQIPTASAILAPLLDLFPSFRNFVVPSHEAVCPRPQIQFFGDTISLDSHCVVLDAVRPTLYAVMAFVWVAIAMFVILAA